MPVERVSIDGSSGTSLPPVDVPGTSLDLGALAAMETCVAGTLVGIAGSDPVLAVPTCASLAGIEIVRLPGRAILIASQD
jgi:hypothetical protein